MKAESMKLYVQAKSKAAINRDLQAGKTFTGVNYSMFGGGGVYELNSELQSGTIVAVYEKTINGSPYAKSWGTWDAEKNKLK